MQERSVQVGVAQVDITPGYPIRLSGYGVRRSESERVSQRIWAKALAIGSDAAGPAVLVTVDNCGTPGELTEEIAARLGQKAGISRDRFAVSFSHTHTAPCLRNAAPFLFGMDIPDDHQATINRYTGELTDWLEEVALGALADRRPGRLAWAEGQVEFAANRRTAGGPVDHALPMMRVTDTDGNLRAVWAGYACHCTTLGAHDNFICGDWAGIAQQYIQHNHPGAVALITIGCGADANPFPLPGLDYAREHGEAIAREVGRLLGGTLTPISGEMSARLERIQLPFDTQPTLDEWRARARKSGPIGYHAEKQIERLEREETLPATLSYPVQSWMFGSELAVIFLAGEVVVDYALRLKRELEIQRVWINAYTNDFPCYIPSRRVLQEGGYEGGDAMVYFDQPTRFASEVEEIIISTVHESLTDDLTTFKIQFVEESGQDRVGEGVRAGLPFAKGALPDSGSIALTDSSGHPIPAQFKPLVHWDGGSIRWLLASFQLDLAAGGQTTIKVRAEGGGAESVSPLAVAEGDQIRIETGTINVRVGAEARDSFLVEDANSKGLLRLRPTLAVYTGDGATHTADTPDTAEIEDNGPVCVVVFVAGPMRSSADGVPIFRYETRLTFWRGQSDIKAEHTVVNVGSAEIVEVDEASIELETGQSFSHSSSYCMISTSGEPCHIELNDGDTVSLEQISHFWQELGTKSKETGDVDYYVIESDFGYTIVHNDNPIGQGEKATGWILGTGEPHNFGVAVGDFWEHGNKRLVLHQDGRLKIDLYPRWEYDTSQPRPKFGPMEKWVPFWGRGGSNRQNIAEDLKQRGYRGPPRQAPLRFGRTRAITHDVLYHFGLQEDADASRMRLAAHRTPLVPLIDIQHLCATDAMTWVSPADPQRWPIYERGLIEGFARYQNEAVEYGLLHFGDIKLTYGNYMTAPGSYANHEYDTTHGLLGQYVRGGDRDCFHLACQAARHIADLDVDQIEGGGRMHGYLDSGERHEEPLTGHTLDHCYIEGLLNHYCMTGDLRSLRAARRIAESCKEIPKVLKEHGVAGIDCRTIARSCITLLNAYDVTRDEQYLAPAREVVEMLIDYARDPIAGLKGSLGWRPWLGEGEHMAEHLQELLARYHSCTSDAGALEALCITMDHQLAHWDPESERYLGRPDRIGHPPQRFEPPTPQPEPGMAQVLYELPLTYLAKVTGDLSYVCPVVAGFAGYGRGIEKAVGNRAFPGVRLTTPHFIALMADLQIEPEELAKHTMRQVMHAPLYKNVPATHEHGFLEPAVQGEADVQFVDGVFDAPVLQTTDKSYVSYTAPEDIMEQPGTLCFWVSQDFDLKTAAGMPPRPRGLVHIADHGHLTNALDVHLAYNEMWVRLYDHRGWLTCCLLVPVPNWRPGEWHHVAVVWNRFTLTAYVDGLRMAQDRAWLVQGGQEIIHVGWRPLNWFAASRFAHLRICRSPLPGYKIESIYEDECPYDAATRQALARYRDEGRWTFARGGAADVRLTDMCPLLKQDREPFMSP